jgi:SAM-dependent methyltransferase
VPPEYDASRAAYTLTRRPDPHIAAAIERALGDARSVVNVGAGAGAYESRDRDVTAIEPSATMRDQRPPDAARAIAAFAEDLPLADDSVDAALAVLTTHHWADERRGLAEMRRVARRRVVVLTYDIAEADAFWLVRDYLPEIAVEDESRFPPLEVVAAALGDAEIAVVPIARDCTDGFLCPWWQRPLAYCDPDVRANISSFAARDPAVVDEAMRRLERDVADGSWAERNADLLAGDEADFGYRLLVATRAS